MLTGCSWARERVTCAKYVRGLGVSGSVKIENLFVEGTGALWFPEAADAGVESELVISFSDFLGFFWFGGVLWVSPFWPFRLGGGGGGGGASVSLTSSEGLFFAQLCSVQTSFFSFSLVSIWDVGFAFPLGWPVFLFGAGFFGSSWVWRLADSWVAGFGVFAWGVGWVWWAGSWGLDWLWGMTGSWARAESRGRQVPGARVESREWQVPEAGLSLWDDGLLWWRFRGAW